MSVCVCVVRACALTSNSTIDLPEMVLRVPSSDSAMSMKEHTTQTLKKKGNALCLCGVHSCMCLCCRYCLSKGSAFK